MSEWLICLCLWRLFYRKINNSTVNYLIKGKFLGSFAKFKKSDCQLCYVCLSFCLSLYLSVSLSACMKQLDSQWKDFREILYLSIFPKSVKKIIITCRFHLHVHFYVNLLVSVLAIKKMYNSSTTYNIFMKISMRMVSKQEHTYIWRKSEK